MAAHEPELVIGLVELDRTSLRERAMTMLRTALAAREMPPGTRLVETELSTAMGISRGTLREALRQLEYEGLVEVGERGRVTVRTATPAELRDMFTVRAALEGLAASIVAARPDRGAAVVRLRAAVESFESAGGSVGDVLHVDLAFHRLLCELTGNATLVRAWGALTGPIRMAVMVAGPDRALAPTGRWPPCPRSATGISSTRSPPVIPPLPGARSMRTCATPPAPCWTPNSTRAPPNDTARPRP